MPFHIVRRHKTGSLSDDFNDGRVGQFRSIENARGAYSDQINRERKAQIRWRHEQELRMNIMSHQQDDGGEDLITNNNDSDNYFSSSNNNSSQRRPTSAILQQPIVLRDIFGNVSAIVPKRSQFAAEKNSANANTKISEDIGTSYARDTHFIVLPKQGYLPSNIPLTASSIAAAGGSGIAPRNGGWNFNYHRREKEASTCSLPNIRDQNNNNRSFSSAAPPSIRRRNMRSVDSDDDDAISVASTTLSRKEDRDVIKSRLADLQNEISTGSKQRQKLENQIDELTELIVNFKKEESEKKKLVGTFGNLESPVQVTYRAQRAPGIKTGMSGFASSRKQDPKMLSKK